MFDFIFNPQFTAINQLLLHIILLLALSALIFYLIFLVLTKLLYRKTSLSRDNSLGLTLLWTFFALMIVFNLYFFLLVKLYEILSSKLNWQKYGQALILNQSRVIIAIKYTHTHILWNNSQTLNLWYNQVCVSINDVIVHHH